MIYFAQHYIVCEASCRGVRRVLISASRLLDRSVMNRLSGQDQLKISEELDAALGGTTKKRRIDQTLKAELRARIVQEHRAKSGRETARVACKIRSSQCARYENEMLNEGRRASRRVLSQAALGPGDRMWGMQMDGSRIGRRARETYVYIIRTPPWGLAWMQVLHLP